MSDQATPFRIFFPIFTENSSERELSPTLQMIVRAMGFSFGGEEFLKLITNEEIGASKCTNQADQDFNRDRIAWLTFTSKAAWLEFVNRNFLQCKWGDNLAVGEKPVEAFLTGLELQTRMLQHLQTVSQIFLPYDVDFARINDIATSNYARELQTLFESGCYTLMILRYFFSIHSMHEEEARVTELLHNAQGTWDEVRKLENLPGKANEYRDIDWHEHLQKPPAKLDAPIQRFLQRWANADDATVYTPGC